MRKTSKDRNRFLALFYEARRGNFAVITALLAVPLIFLMGMGVDYTLASYRQDQLAGFSDAAALAAVTPAMMTKSSTVAQTQAQSMFFSQANALPNVAFPSGGVNVTAVDTTNSSAVSRTVTVSYSAQSSNIFASVLGMNSIPISGHSTATSSVAPKINFYLLLDDSPSMAIAATQTDINTMVSHTAAQGGCAFACHEKNPAADNLGNPGGEDNYTLARNLGVTLRIDNVNSATQSLMSYATNTEAQNNTTYKAAIYTMDIATNPLVATPSSLSTAQTAASNIAAQTVYQNGYTSAGVYNNDENSYLDAALSTLNNTMPAPGNGTNNYGDTPQEVLFIVSDGLTDYSPTNSAGNRVMSPINSLTPNMCTAIKNRNIRIAFLYLTYYPLPTNSFYNANIAPIQSSLATSAQNCASSGLYFSVDTGGDITAAMQQLFAKVVATARLSQ